ncbi:MAG: hypothetical protein AAF662_00860 [Pseudomonadota bacterium]
MSTLFCIADVHDLRRLEDLDAYLTSTDSVLLIDCSLEPELPDDALLCSWSQRGVTLFRLTTGYDGGASPHAVIQSVDYAGWVSLAERHLNQLWWR